ncbi:MBL fold metallo-hydrolase [Brevundimonas sp.]|uniref:MBL fold metallo-hydrolase n=2 Tax=Brevundimonas sp. TaxID=1871086 RepID=UPI002FC6F10E
MWTGLAAALLVVVVMGVVALNLRPSLDDWPRVPIRKEPLATGLGIRFIGTSGVVLSDDRTTLVIDGFVTRPPLWQVLFGRVQPDAEQVRKVRARTGVSRLDAVMVAHSHYDHAMDAPEWVKQAGGEVWGTLSTLNIARAEGVQATRIIGPHDQIERGLFHVRVFGLDHAPPERMQGIIHEGFHIPARATDYKTGGGLGFYVTHGSCRILAVPSAGRAQTDLSQYPADVILLSIGQLGLQDRDAIETYWRDTVVASGAKLVIPVHWDDFSRSLDAPLKPLPYAFERVDVAMREIMALAGDGITVALPVLYEPLDLSASGAC